MMNVKSATSFKILFSQDKTIIYLQYIQHVQKIFHDLQEIFPISYNKYLIIITLLITGNIMLT